jgi:hypothetical protein
VDVGVEPRQFSSIMAISMSNLLAALCPLPFLFVPDKGWMHWTTKQTCDYLKYKHMSEKDPNGHPSCVSLVWGQMAVKETKCISPETLCLVAVR